MQNFEASCVPFAHLKFLPPELYGYMHLAECGTFSCLTAANGPVLLLNYAGVVYTCMNISYPGCM
jgi:hypothetical protein